MSFLQLHFKSLNYDAQQIYSLLMTHIKSETAKRSEIASDLIVQRWIEEIVDQKILRIEKINAEEETEEDEESDESNQNGYDSLINTNRDENFVISLSTDREEICVWNVLKWVVISSPNFPSIWTFFFSKGAQKFELWKAFHNRHRFALLAILSLRFCVSEKSEFLIWTTENSRSR